jgi:hypothetical protein
VRRLPRAEQLDRIVAAALVVLSQIELWVGNAIPGVAKPLAVPLTIVIAGSVAFRRRRPLAVGAVVLAANAALILAGGPGASVAEAVGWMCSLYAIAVWTRHARLPDRRRPARVLERARRAGLAVTLDVEGEAVPLPAGVDLCDYRVIQEGLTNALKHAGPAHAGVLLRYLPHALELEVRDDGCAGTAAADGSGHGLIGMRECVALYGGTLQAGPRAHAGFEIRVQLPLA